VIYWFIGNVTSNGACRLLCVIRHPSNHRLIVSYVLAIAVFEQLRLRQATFFVYNNDGYFLT